MKTFFPSFMAWHGMAAVQQQRSGPFWATVTEAMLYLKRPSRHTWDVQRTTRGIARSPSILSCVCHSRPAHRQRTLQAYHELRSHLNKNNMDLLEKHLQKKNSRTRSKWFEHNIWAIMVKIKLPKNSLSMVIFWIKVRKIELEVIPISVKTDVSRLLKTQ